MKAKKILKWAAISVGIVGTAVGVYAVATRPELREEITNLPKKIGGMFGSSSKSTESAQGETASPVSEQQPSQQPQTQANEPRREGRNGGGYFKPRYNNNNHNNNKD